MRTIKEIIIHCSATSEGVDYTVRDIDRWHREKGWNGCGYHYVVLLDGTIEQGRPLRLAGAHCLNHNAHSIGICYIGGLDSKGTPSDTRTQKQRDVLRSLVQSLKKRFPGATVHGHNEFAAKACPCFRVKEEFETNSAS